MLVVVPRETLEGVPVGQVACERLSPVLGEESLGPGGP